MPLVYRRVRSVMGACVLRGVAGVFETVLCSRRSLASPTFYFLHVSETVLELHGAVRSSVIGVVS